MTVERRLRGARIALVSAAVLRALLWGAAGALLVLALAAVVDLLAGLPLGARERIPPAAGAVGLLAATALLARGGVRPSLESVALWIEARVPRLEYALVTAAERSGVASALERRVAAERWDGVVGRAAARAVLPPLALALAAGAALLLLPEGARARVVAPRPGDAVDRPVLGGDPESRLAPLAVTVVPPAYANEASLTVEDPASVQGLVGSTVIVRGRGRAAGLRIAVGERTVRATDDRGRWRASFAMPARPAAVRLADGGDERLILLDPRTDSVPTLVLESPARDSVLRAGKGTVRLAAAASDDVGLAGGAFEYIVSSGSGESFTFRSGTVGARALGGRRADLAAVLVLDSLALTAGDVVHLSAVARDRNAVSGPGIGRSETRTFRVARAGEYDSVSIEAAPPPEADKSVLSQRMLLVLTEALERRRPRIGREALVRESRGIAADQRRLRRQVGDIVFTRTGAGSGAEHSHEGEDENAHAGEEGMTAEQRLLAAAEAATHHDVGEPLDFREDESPVVSINRPLLEAYNHMWEAASELEIGEPGRAIPPMRRALDAIQRARQAERVYLRGRPPEVVIDLARVRLVGKGPEAPAAGRAPRRSLGDGPRQRLERMGRAFALVERDARAAVDSLLLVRLDALGDSPALAAALGEAIDALRSGRDATEALVRARRLAGMEPASSETLPLWGTLP